MCALDIEIDTRVTLIFIHSPWFSQNGTIMALLHCVACMTFKQHLCINRLTRDVSLLAHVNVPYSVIAQSNVCVETTYTRTMTHQLTFSYQSLCDSLHWSLCILWCPWQCTATCGNGIQVRVINCRIILKGKAGQVKMNVPPYVCIANGLTSEPPIARACKNLPPCQQCEFTHPTHKRIPTSRGRCIGWSSLLAIMLRGSTWFCWSKVTK